MPVKPATDAGRMWRFAALAALILGLLLWMSARLSELATHVNLAIRTKDVHESDTGSVTMWYARARARTAGSSDPLVSLVAPDLDNVASVYPLVRASSQRS